MTFKHHHTKKIIKWLLFLVALFVLLISFALGSYLLFEKKFENKIYPGINIGNIDLGGMTNAQAQEALNKKVNSLNQEGLVFSYQNKQAKIFPTISSVDGDLAYEIINFDINKSIERVIQLGRENSPIKNLGDKIKLAIYSKQSPLYFTLNKKEIFKLLKNDFNKFEIEPQNAKLIFNNNTFTIDNEKLGNILDYNKGIDELADNLVNFQTNEIVLESKIEMPKIFKNKTSGLEEKALIILNNAPLKLIFDSEKFKLKNAENRSWLINKKTLAEWLTIKNRYNTSEEKESIYIGLDENIVEEYFNENISPEIKIEPQDAKFEVKDGRVIEFQESKDGLEINFEASFNLLENKFIGENETEIYLAATELKSKLQTEDVNDLGINEIIGTGHSSFSGSPSNRRHNIATGAAALNGLIVKPDEELSLIAVLGDIDKESGYLPELVIKGNETIAEYGGGLCQIGTTLFRTVLQSGLPVTMRRNHSYRVFYYEPAGTDATIYDPWPDFRFINDTKNNILIQARIEGDDIYFDFWGTKDGRKIEVANPTIYNITKPAPTKLVETLDLPVGKKKCTEHAHNGADAFFDYTVTYSEDNVVEKRFSSHYVPWREVCLIGVEKLSSEEDTATTSEKILEE